MIDSNENKQKILDNFLKIVSFEGWSKQTLILAFKNSNIDQKLMPIIFENDIFSLIEFLTHSRCEELRNIVNNDQNFNTKKTHDKISYLIFNLLNLDKNNKIALKRLINFYLNPKNFIPTNNFTNVGFKPLYQSFEGLYYVSDFLWNICSDKSTDFNFYSKRILLAKILMRCFIFYVDDESENSKNTKSFIDSQINKVINFSKIKKLGKEKIAYAKNDLLEKFSQLNLNSGNPIEIIKNLPFLRLIKTNIFK